MKLIIFLIFVGLCQYLIKKYKEQIDQIYKTHVTTPVAVIIFTLPAYPLMFSTSMKDGGDWLLGGYCFVAMLFLWWLSGKRAAVNFSFLLFVIVIAISFGIFD